MRLRTFGGLWIEADSPVPPLGPRRMALLALVAAAGQRGVSRERIVGILWGETGEEQARHTLSQNLYMLRRETGRDWIVASPELRLDVALSSDVADFQEALAANDPERAATLYAGDFLEGFYLPGAPEFERWAEEERIRLRRAALRALESLAARADDAHRHQESIGWWRRLAELDPLSARYGAGLMRALAAAGDQAAALSCFRAYRDVVRRELDADPDPAILALATSFRHTTAAAPEFRPATAAAAVPLALSADPGFARPRRRIPVLVVAVVALAAMVALAAAAWRLVGPGSAPPRPFLAVGEIRTADSLALGGVLRDMLATGLGSIRGLQVVANSRLLELTPRGADSLRGAMSDAARRAGANELIEGELVAEAGELRLRLRRVALPGGVVRQGYSVRGPDASRLIDSATAAIARDLGVESPDGSVAGIRTASPGAYALYEEGLRAFYSGDIQTAHRLMKAALERDSSFAMAAYYAWESSKGVVPGLEGDGELRRRARRLAPRTSDRERLLIEGSVAMSDASVATSIAIADTLSMRYPGDPDGQLLLGAAQHNAGNRAAAVAALERVVAMDSLAGATATGFCRSCIGLHWLSLTLMASDSLEAAERAAHRHLALRSAADPRPWGILAEPLLRQGRRAEARAALHRQDSLSSGFYFWARGVVQRDLIRWGELEELDRQLRADLANPSVQVHGAARWLLLISLRNQGRLREALALPNDDLGQALVAMERGRPLEAARLYRRIASADLGTDLSPALKARTLAWRWTHVATALAAAGDTAAVRRLADTVEQFGRGSNFGRDPRLHHFLRGLLLQRDGRHAEAVERFRLAMHSPSDGYSRINLELARSLMGLGRPEEAIAVLRPAVRGGVDGSNSYLTHTELREAMAQAFELAGRFDSAAVHYRAVERAWRHADPQFSTRYAKAKAGARMPL